MCLFVCLFLLLFVFVCLFVVVFVCLWGIFLEIRDPVTFSYQSAACVSGR